MSDPGLRFARAKRVAVARPEVPFGQLLVNAGLITQPDLNNALNLQKHVDAQIGDVLVAEGLVDESDVLDALSLQHRTDRIDLDRNPPTPVMAKALPARICTQHRVVPWRWVGETLLVATAHPGRLHLLLAELGPEGPAIIPIVAAEEDIRTQIQRLYGAQLAKLAVSRVSARHSARGWGINAEARSQRAIAFLVILGSLFLLSPFWFVVAALVFGALTLAATAGLKAAAFLAEITREIAEPLFVQPPSKPFRLPKVSVIVPLYKETEIAGALISRLERLTYPKSLLNVILVLEAKDKMTRQTLTRTPLPRWMTVIEVPDDGAITTKPRALNYALDFCQGSIVGVWDAEDAPEPDQIEKVVARFQAAPRKVACLQGVLDYYNARSNWMARCFAIEYATWWRVVLPGLSQLGFAIPLGGTTLFFRREVLEQLGGWDAHNVTEDADLGVRLARRGYITELLPTVTFEEANCRPIRWVRQRSRWLKGFMITYLVHMRHPLELLRDLGLKRFFGVQVIFMATFVQFAAMPFLWSFWLPVFGIPHPAETVLTDRVLVVMAFTFIAAELLNALIGMYAVSGPRHRHLLPWVLTMPVYFTLGAFAAYKALFEMIFAPYYWDKTQHGLSASTRPGTP